RAPGPGAGRHAGASARGRRGLSRDRSSGDPGLGPAPGLERSLVGSITRGTLPGRKAMRRAIVGLLLLAVLSAAPASAKVLVCGVVRSGGAAVKGAHLVARARRITPVTQISRP